MPVMAELPPGFEECAALVSAAGDASTASAVLRFGQMIAEAQTLSFDDEARAREVAGGLEQPPLVGQLAAALVAWRLLVSLGDSECAGYAVLRLFRARKEAGDAGFMVRALLEAMIESPFAFDEHEDVLRWAFATLAPAERARWAASLAAANDDIGLETTGGWLAEASACVADDGEFRGLVERAYALAGLSPAFAAEAIERVGR